jgi:hypothetical protein
MGDVAHSMTMCELFWSKSISNWRGAATHRITNAARLSQKLRDMMKVKQGQAIAEYETEVRERTFDSSPLFSGHSSLY